MASASFSRASLTFIVDMALLYKKYRELYIMFHPAPTICTTFSSETEASEPLEIAESGATASRRG